MDNEYIRSLDRLRVVYPKTIHTYTYVHTDIHTYVHAHAHGYIYILTYVRTYIHTYITNYTQVVPIFVVLPFASTFCNNKEY